MSEWTARVLAPILAETGRALVEAYLGLAATAAVFLTLALILRRGGIGADIRRVLPETRLNLLLMTFNTLLVVPAITMLSIAMARAFDERGIVLVSPAAWTGLPAPVVIVIAVIAGDFIGYWRHRLEHSALLWPSHAIHHSDTEMTWMAIERFHPINWLTTALIDTAFLLWLGLPPFAVAANRLVRHYYGAFIHADLDWTYGPLGRAFVSPAMHRWHHARDGRISGKNFATVLAIWDQAFGTFHLPGPCKVALGVEAGPARGLVAQLAWPFRPRAYRALTRRAIGAAPGIPPAA